jgi:hypothetical protein
MTPLPAGSGGLGDLVRCGVYLDHMADFDEMNDTYLAGPGARQEDGRARR